MTPRLVRNCRSSTTCMALSCGSEDRYLDVQRACWCKHQCPQGYRELFSSQKKGINLKNLGRTPPPRPPLEGTPDPHKFFLFGASFPFRTQEKRLHKEFRGGGSWGPRILYAEFLRVNKIFTRLSRDLGGFCFCAFSPP